MYVIKIYIPEMTGLTLSKYNNRVKLNLSIFVSVINAASKNLSFSCSANFVLCSTVRANGVIPKPVLADQFLKWELLALLLYPYRWVSVLQMVGCFPALLLLNLLHWKPRDRNCQCIKLSDTWLYSVFSNVLLLVFVVAIFLI